MSCCGSRVNASEVYTCCSGKAVLGPDTHVLSGSLFLLVAPGALCFGYSSASWVASIFGTVLLLMSIVFLIRTAITDPGFLPKQPPPGDADVPKDRNRIETVQVPISDGKVRQVKIERRWCYSCNLLRPPRASHCPYCNACVERMDHHCPWTGTCIGRRNYRYFVLFLWSVTLLCLFVLALSIYGIIKRQRDYLHGPVPPSGSYLSGAQSVVEGQRRIYFLDVVTLLYALIFLCLVGGLTGYHTHLVVHNLTTHEEMKAFYGNDPESPFHRGLCGNLAEVFCWPLGPSKVARLRDDEPSDGHRQPSPEEGRIRHVTLTPRPTLSPVSSRRPAERTDWSEPPLMDGVGVAAGGHHVVEMNQLPPRVEYSDVNTSGATPPRGTAEPQQPRPLAHMGSGGSAGAPFATGASASDDAPHPLEERDTQTPPTPTVATEAGDSARPSHDSGTGSQRRAFQH